MPVICVLGGGYDCSCGRAVGCRSGYTRTGMETVPRVPPPCQSELACVAAGYDFDPRAMFSPNKIKNADDLQGCLFYFTETWSAEKAEQRHRLLRSGNVTEEVYDNFMEVRTHVGGKPQFKRKMLICACHFNEDDVVVGQISKTWKLIPDVLVKTPRALIAQRRQKPTSMPKELPLQRNMVPQAEHLQAQLNVSDQRVTDLISEIQVLEADVEYLLEQNALLVIERDDARLELEGAKLLIEERRLDLEMVALEIENDGKDLADVEQLKEYNTLLADYLVLGNFFPRQFFVDALVY